MGQRLMGHILPAEVACSDAIIEMGSEKSALILIKHCQDMKQQEMRLRLITLLLVLLCTALYIFAICTDLRQHEKSGSTGQGSAVAQSPAYSKQETVCPAATDNPQRNPQRMRIHLRSVAANNSTDRVNIEWKVVFGEKYIAEKRAIVIPETSIYFVYVRIALSCQEKDKTASFTGFHVVLNKWNEGYNKTVAMTQASDGIACTSQAFRNVFVGRLFELLEGDLVSVWIEEGYKLITKASFGAYLA
ncbi:uncharacterized protein LOC119914897 [Micropterus salmoides]|uniref:uncharacterized protein LOC119914897 n=1 Tax=Micropterus salmoides TaxID=27706 RepID=UPI0018EB233E|nr:uncharacterized protein LOC119914897 [Micropterus salmoides]